MTELLKQALETIMFLKRYCESGDPGLEIDATVIAKLEKAIAQAEREARKLTLAKKIPAKGTSLEVPVRKHWNKVYSERPQPVAWMTFTPYGDEDDIWYENPKGKLSEGWTYTPLYTAPPLQSLTDEQLEQMWEADKTSPEDCQSLYYFKKIARAVEAKLMEKNNA
jgi:hypothetical protein